MIVYQCIVRGTAPTPEIESCMKTVKRFYPKRQVVILPNSRKAACLSAIKDRWLWKKALSGEDFLYIDWDVKPTKKLDCGDGSRVACGETRGAPDTQVFRSFGLDLREWEEERLERGISEWGRCFPRKIMREKDVFVVTGFDHLYHSTVKK